MKKFIAISICALLGIAFGYAAAPIASTLFIESTEPDMLGAFMLSVADAQVVCDCQNRPASESIKSVTDALTALQHWSSQNPNSVQLKQEIGLVDVHLSRLNQELGQQSQAAEEMKQAQAEFTTLGWKDISPEHLIALTKQLDSEYKNPNQPNKTAVPEKLASVH
jgi:hypothetical protein